MPADMALRTDSPAAGPRLLPKLGLLALRVLTPIGSVLVLWYLAIWFSGLPAFVIPRPERVIEALWVDHAFIFEHLLATLVVAAIGFIWANVAGIGLAVLFDLLPPTRHMLMPAAITLRNVPYIALISVLMLAFGDSILSKTAIVALAGFFPVLVNTLQGLRSADEVQLDLIGDYRSNVALYPVFQAYLREHQPPVLAAWGRNDPFFLPAGAEAFKRDVPGAVVKLYDTGHFALETHAAEIAADIRAFLAG